VLGTGHKVRRIEPSFPVKHQNNSNIAKRRKETSPFKKAKMVAILAFFAMAFALLLRASSTSSASADLEDKFDNICEEMVHMGKCQTEPDLMLKYCEKSCAKWQKGKYKVEVERVTDDEPSFFELSAKTATGSTMHFDRFEGYITIVVNMAKACSPTLDLEEGLKVFEHFHDTWPYVLEIMVFPFQHPRVDYVKKDCSTDESTINKNGRHIHMMEEAEINGEHTHPVYKYLKKKFKIEELDPDMATYFLINPDGDTIEAHHGATVNHMKHYIRQHLEKDL
jgi:glutathione peroxidase